MKNNLIRVSLSFDKTQEVYEAQADWTSTGLYFKDETNHEHHYQFFEDGIRLVKHGDSYLDFTFSKEVSNGIYRLGNQTFQFEIKTHHINLSENLLDIQYDLIQHQEIMSRHIIEIKRLT